MVDVNVDVSVAELGVSAPRPHRTSRSSKSSYRYPFAPFPDGWFLLLQSHQLAVGDVLPLRYFGRDLVAYRTEGGRAVVADAHCPHMGAHIGYGGAVEGEGVRCPFHNWRFAADGRCDDVPYLQSGSIPDVCIQTWPVHETSGLIHMWFSAAGNAPLWLPPERAEFGQPGWIGYETAGWTIRMHVQELSENIPDMPHFNYVHGVGTQLRAVVDTDAHVYRQRSLVTVDGSEHEFTSQEAHGLGLVWLRTSGQLETYFLTATTPIDDEYVELRLLFLVRDADGSGTLPSDRRALLDATIRNVERDVPIWEHKVYRERAPLVQGDGPIGVLRKWARQFYPD